MSKSDGNEHASLLPGLIFIGFAATVIGIGLGRFSFVALIPVLINGGWADGETAGFLAASNLLGYLLGALTANRFGRRFGAFPSLAASMVVCSASFFASAWNLGPEWLAFWRLVAGATGGVLMVLAAPSVLSAVPARLKGRVTGLIFSGIGVGVALSGFVVPWAADLGVVEAWSSLGLLCVLASLPCFLLRNTIPRPQSNGAAADRRQASTGILTTSMILLLAAYALEAVGFIPHTIYWADFLVRSLGHSTAYSGFSWSQFGFGAIGGPVIAGLAADRFGFRRSLVGAFAIKAAAVAIPVFSRDSLLLSLSVLLVGALTPGIVTLMSGAAAALVGSALHGRAWATLTFTFAVFQALGGYAISGLYSLTGSHITLFVAGSGALCLGLLCTLAILLISPPKD